MTTKIVKPTTTDRSSIHLRKAFRQSEQWGPRYSIWLALAFLVTLVLPSVSYLGHGLTSTWLVYAFWMVAIIMEYPRIIPRVWAVARGRRFELMMFGAWLFLVFVNFALGRAFSGAAHMRITITFAMIIVMDLVYTAIGEKWRRSLTTALFILLGIEIIRSIPLLWSDPLLVRNVMFQGGDSPLYSYAFLSGIGEYGLYTGCAIITPVLLATALNNRGWRRAGLLATWGALLVAIVLTTLLGAVLLTATGLVLQLVLAVASSRKNLRFRVIFAIIAIIGLAIAVAWLVIVGPTEQGRMLIDKFSRQSTSVLDKGVAGGDLTGRTELWLQSIDTFLKNPIFGIGPVSGTENPFIGYLVGGHSSLLDLPAEYGLFGIIFYFGFILTAFKRAIVSFAWNKHRLLSQARVVSGLLFLIGGSYNPIAFFIIANMFFYQVALGGLNAQSVPISGPQRNIFRVREHIYKRR